MAAIKRITLSYREQSVGGEVRAFPKISVADERALSCAQHVVLLIHGYNNDAAEAEQAYAGFFARQRDLDPDERYGIGRTFVDVCWPGDAAWGFASFLFYMGSVTHAIQTAERLATYLAEHIASATRIDLVAHSVGCRVGLELLKTLEAKQFTLQMARMVFMAGAVPIFMLEQGNPPRRLRPVFDHRLCEGARSLYSGADMVLAFAFPAGQSLAPGAEGFLPTALGHALWVDPEVPHTLGQQENPNAGHSDYWGWNTRSKPLQCARKAAQEINCYLQFPTAGSRVIGSRLAVENDVIAERANLASREMVSREIAARES